MSQSDLPQDRLVDEARSFTPNRNEVLVRVDQQPGRLRLPLNRRTVPLLAAAAVLGVAGPAVALNGRVGSRPHGDPAPPPARVTFSEAEPAPPGKLAGMDDGAPAGM